MIETREMELKMNQFENYTLSDKQWDWAYVQLARIQKKVDRQIRRERIWSVLFSK